MPDANGKFKGISVPAVPWHEQTPDEREITVAAGTTGIVPRAAPEPLIASTEEVKAQLDEHHVLMQPLSNAGPVWVQPRKPAPGGVSTRCYNKAERD